MDVEAIVAQTRRSVLQIKAFQALYDPLRPYLPPTDDESHGSGFIIDGPVPGLVVTNAHVVANAMKILARLDGTWDLSLEVIGVSRERDLALCRIRSYDLDITGLSLGDDLDLAHASPVVVLGYPFKETTINVTTGVISGFRSGIRGGPGPEDQEPTSPVTDAYLRSPSYIQITAPINPGTSGGPVLDRNGQVVAIIASGIPSLENIGYAIGVRTLQALLPELLGSMGPRSCPRIVQVPTLGLEWSRTSPALLEMLTPDSQDGIYVRDLLPDSLLQGLESGDLITQLSFHSVEPSKKLVGQISRSGLVRLADQDKPLRSLEALIEMCPIGAPVQVQFYRNRQKRSLTVPNIYRPADRVMERYPYWQPFDYETVAGLVIMERSLNQIKALQGLDQAKRDDLRIMQPYYGSELLIVQILPGANRDQIVHVGQTIERINGCKVTRLDQVRAILATSTGPTLVETQDRTLFMAE